MLAPLIFIGIGALGTQSAKPGPCKDATDGYFIIEHQPGARWKTCEARIGKQRTIRIVIKHASPFLYDYAAEGVALPTEESTGPLKQLLGLEGAATTAKAQEVTPEEGAALSQAARDFVEDLAALDVFRRYLLSLLVMADRFEARDPTGAGDNEHTDAYITNKMHADVATGLKALPSRLQPFTELSLQRTLVADFGAMKPEDQKALQGAKDAAIAALPALVALYDGVRTYSQGPHEVMFTYVGDGDVLARVKVTYRLKDLGLDPARPIGLLDAAVLQPQFKRFRFSSGLTFDIASDPTFRLVSKDAQAGGPPFSVVSDNSTSRLKITPSVLFNVMWPFPTKVSRWSIGMSGGFGIKSTDLKQVDDQTTIMIGALTVAYEGILFSLGPASVARPVGLEGVDKDSTTSDPNALNNVRTSRDWRWFAGMHLTF